MGTSPAIGKRLGFNRVLKKASCLSKTQKANNVIFAFLAKSTTYQSPIKGLNKDSDQGLQRW
jgi:hypothetical protein